jgi:hypothetical protein
MTKIIKIIWSILRGEESRQLLPKSINIMDRKNGSSGIVMQIINLK